MKVIIASCPKTGTKSVKAALQVLGYNVYDYLEQCMYQLDDWKKILDGDGGKDDLKKMFENVDAVVDNPSFIFWKEIHNAFPDAKIIFTDRDEESWINSLKKQTDEFNKGAPPVVKILMEKFAPTYRKMVKFLQMLNECHKMIRFEGFFYHDLLVNELVARQKFRKQRVDVLQNAPKDKLLVFNLKDGWDPLCKCWIKKYRISHFHDEMLAERI